MVKPGHVMYRLLLLPEDHEDRYGIRN
jgi:hypothetical protein